MFRGQEWSTFDDDGIMETSLKFLLESIILLTSNKFINCLQTLSELTKGTLPRNVMHRP